MTGVSNRERVDIGCVFGCRREREREKTNERGRRYYRSIKGKTSKGARNRDRSLITAQRSKIASTPLPLPKLVVFARDTVLHIAYLLCLESGEKILPGEIEHFLHEALAVVIERARTAILRQRSLPERGG